MILVDLSLATICFLGQCHPILVGPDTPTGTYKLVKRYTDQKGYGGDVLQFYENKTHVFAVHRVWTLIPKQQREQRLKSSNVKDRYITNGCINVDPVIYQQIVDCCSSDKIVITK